MSKVLKKNADIESVSKKEKIKTKNKENISRKGLENMRIENEMLSRFGSQESLESAFAERSLSSELDFFFDNVMDTVVEYFQEKQELRV